MTRPMTMIEKILARAAGRGESRPGDFLTCRIDAAMMPDNFLLVGRILEQANIRPEDFTIRDPDRFHVFIDHRVPAGTLAFAENQKRARELAETLRVKHFHDVFAGICHQVMMERGYVAPGELVLGADSHSTSYGALNAAGTGIGASEMVYAMHTGELWFRVPETLRIEVDGELAPSVGAKDILLYVAARFGTEVAQYQAIEWAGPAVEALSLDARMTIANMSVELGAKVGLFEADRKVLDYAAARVDRPFTPVAPDPDAGYAALHRIPAAAIEPQVALPHSVGNVQGVSTVGDRPIQQAVIASCCNGRIEDLEIAAAIVKGRRVHPGVRFYVAPASWALYKEAADRGLLGTLVEAGVMIGNPSCGFCTGFQGVLAAGDACIAATPRNFRGRMGSPDAEIYLASPATVAASALAGRIADPRELDR